MTPTDFAAALDYLGLRQAAFARIAGVHTTTVSRWATGASSVPIWAAFLLIMMRVLKEAADTLEARIGAEYPERDRYPTEQRRYDRDMEIVRRMRGFLAERSKGDCQDFADERD